MGNVACMQVPMFNRKKASVNGCVGMKNEGDGRLKECKVVSNLAKWQYIDEISIVRLQFKIILCIIHPLSYG